jgi:hypothetical protein
MWVLNFDYHFLLREEIKELHSQIKNILSIEQLVINI